MQLDGIHHITCITADARANVDFYARVLGLRLVKKTVNFDAPDVYHLYYGDEHGSPGSILTFFEFPGAARGHAGAGMIHRLRWRVGSGAALEFWADRLGREGIATAAPDAAAPDAAPDAAAPDTAAPDTATTPQTATPALSFADPEGLALELAVVETDDPPLVAAADGIPAEHALQGFDGVRAYAAEPEREEHLLTGPLGFQMTEPGVYELAGARHAFYARDEPPAAPGAQGAGTVHHVAWCDRDDEHAAWRRRVSVAGARPTQVIDRQYFLSIYFREPGGVLFELATPSPGFAIDEDPDHLGEQLRLPPQYEPRRERLEHSLIPLVNPRTAASSPPAARAADP